MPLGIRTVKWDAKTGFSINGHHLKLHGWGQKPTDEWPGLGAAQPDWMHFFTLQSDETRRRQLRSLGPLRRGPGADRFGRSSLALLSISRASMANPTRCRRLETARQCFRDALIYFRNQPSILIWEGGNQKVTRDMRKNCTT